MPWFIGIAFVLIFLIILFAFTFCKENAPSIRLICFDILIIALCISFSQNLFALRNGENKKAVETELSRESEAVFYPDGTSRVAVKEYDEISNISFVYNGQVKEFSIKNGHYIIRFDEHGASSLEIYKVKTRYEWLIFYQELDEFRYIIYK